MSQILRNYFKLSYWHISWYFYKSFSIGVYLRREGTPWLAAASWHWGPHLNIKGKQTEFQHSSFSASRVLVLWPYLHEFTTIMFGICHRWAIVNPFLLCCLCCVFSHRIDKRKKQQLRETQEKRNVPELRCGYSYFLLHWFYTIKHCVLWVT